MSEAEDKLDELFLETFETNHPAMLDWVSIKFELAQIKAENERLNGKLCSYAKVKWSVCECNIKNNINADMRTCDGKGTYCTTGNNGFGYKYRCNRNEETK